MRFERYDVIVVGGGHAGCESAAAAANMGSKVLLITSNMDGLAKMSCNPAVGGVAKGQIVREIDAMGGYMGVVTDMTMIQFRMLNKSKGPAMWSPRAQSDKTLFSIRWREILESLTGVDFLQDTVCDVLVENGIAVGVKTVLGYDILGRSVVLTNGTFLNGTIHIGDKSFNGGRLGDSSVSGLTESLIGLGFVADRMKTGTPVRVDGRTIDFSKLIEQPGDEVVGKFSYTDTAILTKQRSCYLAYTNERVHEILKEGFDKSPLFSGTIKGIGPRYCPSIEDKLVKFAEKDRHQLFVEPEGWYTNEYYINGFSSSLPDDIQQMALRAIDGFENAKIFKPGYAIEYDFFPPTQLFPTLETKLVENLYFAGQINGTTGYEEAAAQGMMAGINANNKINGLGSVILRRSDAYIGVLIDDLVTKGVDEPYRMFTSRAEYRTLLRQDNADLRLTEFSYGIGLAKIDRVERLNKKKKIIGLIVAFMESYKVEPPVINPFLQSRELSTISVKQKLATLILRPQVSLNDLADNIPAFNAFLLAFGNTEEEREEVEITLKYESYISKELDMVEKLSRYEDIRLKPTFDYHALKSLSFEAREKLSKIKPLTIGQASRISGISPADISVLIVFISR